MNVNNSTTALTEAAIIAAIMVVFVLFGIYIFPIVLMIYPVPFIILGIRHGSKYNILSMIASSIIVGMFTDITMAMILFIVFGLLAISLTYMIRRKYNTSQIVMFNTAVALISMLIAVAILNYITGTSLISDIEASLSQVLEIQLNTIKDMGLSSYEIIQMTDVLKTAHSYMILLIPFFLIISSMFSAYINYWLSVVVLRRLGNKQIAIPRFKFFSLPRNIILGAFVIFLASALIRYLEILYYDPILINVIGLLIFVFFLQGLAILVYLIDKLKFYKIIKGALIVLAIINFVFIAILSFIGMLDIVFDFRKLRKSK